MFNIQRLQVPNKMVRIYKPSISDQNCEFDKYIKGKKLKMKKYKKM